ncbi:MAG: SDR family NAD(P)-dependent oxidoreductase [Flammeovirgaceae bacterium]|nr:SDR family NAD(P)-dependent oxidoreductase [Flammeovirgaceae bacterium]
MGRSVVDALISKGAIVSAFDINRQGLAELREQHPDITCIECDIADYEQVLAAAARYHAEFKSADVFD